MDVENERLKEGSKDEYESYVETEILNSMIPLWKKSASEVTDEEYAAFYRDKFYDYEKPARVITQKSEGTATYAALMFLPSHAPYNYYTKDYEKGLELYSSGVMIMERCADLLPDYFSFVRGVVDSSDLSLNISREMLQHDRQLKSIAKAVEKKIGAELSKMLESDREKYEQLFAAFGTQLKWGVYSDYGMHKAALQDLILFPSSAEGKLVTLKEYLDRMKKEQTKIYYASGESVEKIALLPQVESVIAHGFEVLYLTEDVDEFALQVLHTYGDKEFVNVCKDDLDLSDEKDKEAIKAENENAKEMLELLREAIGADLHAVRFTGTLQKHAACLSTEGALSANMEKVLSKTPGGDAAGVKAVFVLEINRNHPIAQKLKELFLSDKEKLATYGKVLYAQARLLGGLSVENPAELSDLLCGLMLEG
jgi:molecular chaperone HtpG